MALAGVSLVFPFISVIKGLSATGLALGIEDDTVYFGVIDQVSLSSSYPVGKYILFNTKDAKVVISGLSQYYIVSENNIMFTETAPV